MLKLVKKLGRRNSWIFCDLNKLVGPTVFRRKFCQIPRASSRNSATHRGNIVQIPRLATASHLWLKTEKAVQKLQLLKAGILLKADMHYPSALPSAASVYYQSALSYVSNIKRIFFLFKSAMKLMTHDVSWLKWVTDESVITHHARISPTIVLITGHFSNSAEFYGNVKMPRQRANSTARLKILQPAENCGPYKLAKIALVWCGCNVERPTPHVQPLSGQTAAGSWDLRWCRKTVSCSSWGDMKWTRGPASLQPRLTWIGRAVGVAVAGNSHCDTPRPPVRTATADCQWRLQGHAPSLRRWTYRLALLRFRLWPAAGENPTTQPESWWGSAGVCWPSAKSWCRWDTQWDVRRLPQRPWPKFWRRPAYHQHGAGWGHDERQRGLTQLCCFVANSQSSGFYGK